MQRSDQDTLGMVQKKIKNLNCRLFSYLKRVEERKLSGVDCAQISAIRFMSRHGDRVVKFEHLFSILAKLSTEMFEKFMLKKGKDIPYFIKHQCTGRKNM